MTSSAAPASAGRDARRPRRFSSRHVPSVAEDILHSEVLNAPMEKRFAGLMKYLKRNTLWEEHQKLVLLADSAEMLVPSQYDEALRNEFERRCAFGERMNMEFMSSAKWVKLLRDVRAIGAGVEVTAGGKTGAITLPEADIVFHKVLHNCDHGGQRLTYELFCKALYLVSQAIQPNCQGQGAFNDIISQILNVAPEEPQRGVDDVLELLLEANVVLVLGHFKPALHDLFHAFCGQNLSNLCGVGAVRIKERAIWKHTQETMLSDSLRSSRMSCSTSRTSLVGSVALAPMEPPSLSSSMKFMVVDPLGNSCSSLCTLLGKDVLEAKGQATPPEGSTCSAVCPEVAPGGSCGARAGTGSASAAGSACGLGAGAGTGSASAVGTAMGAGSEAGAPGSVTRAYSVGTLGLGAGTGSASGLALPLVSRLSLPAGSGASVSPSRVCTPRSGRGWSHSAPSSPSSTRGASPRLATVVEDPYVYANGAPVLRNRRQYMSVDQLLSWCSALRVMPDLLTRLEVVRIFRRAQRGGFNQRQSSTHGYLSREAFVSAVGQLAIAAYSKEPFCDEYPEAHEKIYAFLLSSLPGNSREAHDRFLYGCSGRGR